MILINDFQHHSISLLSKSFSNIIFVEPKVTNCKDKAINNANVYYYMNQATHVFKKVSIFNTGYKKLSAHLYRAPAMHQK